MNTKNTTELEQTSKPADGKPELNGGLAACPCGEMPKELYIVDGGQGGKWAWVYPSCCGEWHIEFRTEYQDLDSDRCKELAKFAWNAAPRAAKQVIQGPRSGPAGMEG